MNKKDRLAIAVSVLSFLPLALFIDGNGVKTGPSFLFSAFLISIYWGYRFIKGDISFKAKKSNSNKVLDIEKLQRLQELKESGALTIDEFEEQKAKLMK